jgi:glutamate-1-semialdehyde 2,1-aminomutase
LTTNEFLDPESTSAGLYERARKVMPGGNTRTTVFTAPRPPYAASARGATVTDVDGRERLDFVNNYTALIHGHVHPRIVTAVQQQLGLGSAFAFPTETEITLAEVLADRVPSVDQVRFTNSGTEAVMLAIQGARAFTGRRLIARFDGSYHGTYEFGDVMLPHNQWDQAADLIERHAADLAAVIVDPLPHGTGFVEPARGFLDNLRDLTSQHGIVLISDEIISFRLGYQGAQGIFGFTPDLTTFGKIIGGGFPIGAFGGRADVMSVFDPSSGHPKAPHGGTFNGNPISMVAGFQSMNMLTPAAFVRLGDLGEQVRRALADVFEIAGAPWQVSGRGSLFKLHPHQRPLTDHPTARATPAEEALMQRFYVAMLAEGVILTSGLAGCTSTVMEDQHVTQLAESVERALAASA